MTQDEGEREAQRIADHMMKYYSRPGWMGVTLEKDLLILFSLN